jgi:hypothetical protein
MQLFKLEEMFFKLGKLGGILEKQLKKEASW